MGSEVGNKTVQRAWMPLLQEGVEGWAERKGPRLHIHSCRLGGSGPVTQGESHVVQEEAGPPVLELSLGACRAAEAAGPQLLTLPKHGSWGVR